MVRLGIEAPKALPVYREEIWAAVKEENAAAAATADAAAKAAKAKAGVDEDDASADSES